MNPNPLSIAFKQRNKFICLSCLLRPPYLRSSQQLRLYATAYPQPDPAVAEVLYRDDNDDLILNYDGKWKTHKPSAKRAAKATAKAASFLSVNAKSRKKNISSSLESRREIERNTTASELPTSLTAIEQDDIEFKGKRNDTEPNDKKPDNEKKSAKKNPKVSSPSVSLTQLVKLMRNVSAKKLNKDVKLHDLSRPAEKPDKLTKMQSLSESFGALGMMTKPQKTLRDTPIEILKKGEKPGKDKASKMREKPEGDLRDTSTEILKEDEKPKNGAALKPILHETEEKTKDHKSEKEKSYKERQKLKRANKIKQNKLKKDGNTPKVTSSEVDELIPDIRIGEESSSSSKELQMDAQTSKGTRNSTIRKHQFQTPPVLEMKTDVPEKTGTAMATSRKYPTQKALAQKLETDISDKPTTVTATVPNHRSTRNIVREDGSDDPTLTDTLHKKKPDTVYKTETLIQRLSHEITNLKDSLAVKFAALKLNNRLARALEGTTGARGATSPKVPSRRRIFRRVKDMQGRTGEGRMEAARAISRKVTSRRSLVRRINVDLGPIIKDQVASNVTSEHTTQSQQTLKDALLSSHNISEKAFPRGRNGAIEEVSATQLAIAALEVCQPPVPNLSYGLDRILFNPGVYHLQDPRSQVYNFDPYLQGIMPVSDFDFNALKEYITSSRDRSLEQLAMANGKRYVGSSSSLTGVLAHFHFLLSQWREVNVDMISRRFPASNLKSFTLIQRTPTAIFLRWKNGTYAIDADKEFESSNILSMLGKSMEKLLTLSTDDYERYRRGNSNQIPKEERNAPESYHYCSMGDLLMRSQLDAFDARLPGTGMFDLKTRAVVSVRMDIKNYQEASGYEIKDRHGGFESYEREYYDMIRAAFLKYSLQVRMGRMDGIFVAFHNTERIFGFQYISLAEMDLTIHGQEDTTIGDQEFKLSIDFLNKVLEKATKKYPEQTLRIHFETRETRENVSPFMYIVAEPVTEDQVKALQTSNHAKIEEFERDVLGLDKTSSNAVDKNWDNIQADIQETMDKDERFANDPEEDKESNFENEDGNDSVIHELNNAHHAIVADARNDGKSPLSVASGESGNRDDEGSEDELNGNEEEVEDEQINVATRVENGEDELQDESNVINLQEDNEVNESVGDIVSEDGRVEKAEVEEATEEAEGEDAENRRVGSKEDVEDELTGSGQSVVESDSAQHTDATGVGQGKDEKDAIGVPTTNESALSPRDEEAEGEPVSSSKTHLPNDRQPNDADTSLPDRIDEEQAGAKPLTDILLMTLSIRNKINGQYRQRPRSLRPDDDWTVEYSLVEEPKQSRAQTLYQAMKVRRRKQLTQNEDDSKTEVNYYKRQLRELSRKGRKWREEQDQKNNGGPKVVWGQSSARGSSPDISTHT